ncbi:MAG TPA: acylphosphatase [bacterium]|mgnify:CR=1 FL=1|nr:acylphosphatase [bacterium]
MESIKAKVTGAVQGVGYRYFVIRRSVALGLTGYAKNMNDGSVEVVAEGNRNKLDELIKDLWEGPSFSSVSSVEVEREQSSERVFSGFNIKY